MIIITIIIIIVIIIIIIITIIIIIIIIIIITSLSLHNAANVTNWVSGHSLWRSQYSVPLFRP